MTNNRYFTRARKIAFLVAGVLGLVTAFNACTGLSGSDSGNVASTGTQSTGLPAVEMALSVQNSSGVTIFSSGNSSSTLTLSANQAYAVTVTPATTPAAGTTLALQVTNTSIVNATPQLIPVTFGANVIPANTLAPGNYSLVLSETAPGTAKLNNTYAASVICGNPTFTAASLSAAGLKESAGSGQNLFNFNASAVVAGANGQAPYQCAIDPNGDGIVDTAFQPCSQAFTNLYANYVSTRNVAVVVVDACNISYSISTPLNLAYSVPAIPSGTNFIYGVTSAATSSAATDTRTNGVSYFATNENTTNDDIVQAAYSNSGTFSLTAEMNYKQASSTDFGMTINLVGLTGDVNASTGTGTVSAANATIKSVTYSTDEAGDTLPAVSFTSTNCTLSNQGAKVLFVTGQPCTGGTSGDNNSATVEVWGKYTCTNVTGATGSFTITGSFDGLYNLVDSCVGGGQGGGGVPPQQF